MTNSNPQSKLERLLELVHKKHIADNYDCNAITKDELEKLYLLKSELQEDMEKWKLYRPLLSMPETQEWLNFVKKLGVPEGANPLPFIKALESQVSKLKEELEQEKNNVETMHTRYSVLENSVYADASELEELKKDNLDLVKRHKEDKETIRSMNGKFEGVLKEWSQHKSIINEIKKWQIKNDNNAITNQAWEELKKILAKLESNNAI